MTQKILAGVIGYPVSHSLSPRLHGYWLKHYGIAGEYNALPITPEKLEEGVNELLSQGYAGVNVTVPHKEAIFRLAQDAADAVATRIGAVNTLVFREGKILRATNTDCTGFIENLKAGAPDWEPKTTRAVILGAGGAARGVVVGLQDAGVKQICVLNRTREKAEALAVSVGDWEKPEAAFADATLLINTTSLGMKGGPPLALNLSSLPESAIVTDIVYNPLETPLLAAARARGNKTVDGLGMLLYQAVPGFEAWFGVKPEVTPQLRAHVLAGLV